MAKNMKKERQKNQRDNRVCRYTVRFKVDEAKEIEDNATIAGMTLANYIRHSALGIKIQSSLDLKMINELRKIGGLLKLLHTESNGAYSEQTSQLLNVIQDYILNLPR